MEPRDILIELVIGALAGWTAGSLIEGRGLGLLRNIVVGILGAFIGGFLFGLFGIPVLEGIFGAILTAAVGAAVLLLLIGLLRNIA